MKMDARAVDRRRVLVGALAGIAALITDRFADPVAVSANDPNDVVLGAANDALTPTRISVPDGDALVLSTAGIGSDKAALRATAGTSVDESGIAIDASSGSIAIRGQAPAQDGTGVLGIGQYIGVEGRGQIGVSGASTGGVGVEGSVESGTGVHALATTGTALRVDGRVSFSTAGFATIRAGHRSQLVRPGIDLTAASKIFVTLQTSAGGATTVRRISRDTVGNRFTIYLTAVATIDCRVAWFVVG